MNINGKFIVIDGIDGCGKGTQIEILSEFFSKQGHNIVTKKYPEYGKPIGDLINNWLFSKKYDFNADTQTLLYFADFIKDQEVLKNDLRNGKIILSDRYFTATLAYQQIKGVPIKKLLELSQLFELKKPDLAIYIKISPETSFKRKKKQKGEDKMDRHEENKVFLQSLFKGYEDRVKENTFCKWEVVNGEQSIEKVRDDIINILNKII